MFRFVLLVLLVVGYVESGRNLKNRKNDAKACDRMVYTRVNVKSSEISSVYTLAKNFTGQFSLLDLILPFIWDFLKNFKSF